MKVSVEYEVDNCKEYPYLIREFKSFDLFNYECLKGAWNRDTIPASIPKNCPFNK